jgi:hypothetical protein
VIGSFIECLDDVALGVNQRVIKDRIVLRRVKTPEIGITREPI